MAAVSNIFGDTDIQGKLRAKEFTPPASCITDNSVSVSANIAATKLQHRWRRIFNQAHGSAATAERRAVYYAFTTATILRVRAGSVVACAGDSTITIDVKKNGTTVLTGTIVLDNANTAYIVESAVLSVTALVAGDVLEVVQTVSAGTGTLGQGVFVAIDIDEDAV